MYLYTTILFVIMVASFVICSRKLKSPEISMAITGVVGALVAYFMYLGGEYQIDFPVRILVEGLFTNFDLAISFVCASVFVNLYSYSGAMTAVTRKLVGTFDNKWILLTFMAAFMLVPGALTGAGSISVFVLGGLVATVVRYMGLSDRKTTAFVFIFAILSAACPPINLWTMMMTAQCNMPYVGFTKLLALPIAIVGIFTIIYLGWGSKREPKEKILAELPEAPEKMNMLRILLPLVVVIGLILLTLYAPFDVPVIGLPLTFIIGSFVVVLCNPVKRTFKEYFKVVNDTMEQVFPLVATVLSVGVLQSSMTQIGVKGLIGVTFITLPLVMLYVTVLLFGPFAQGCLSYGSAIIIGAPLVFMFNTRGMDTTVVCAALSLMFPIGDCLPPSRITGRLTCETVGYQGSYMSFLKQIAIPCALLGALALVMFITPGTFTFLK